jgi:peptidyl-prolyl cis-trans isomerase C
MATANLETGCSIKPAISQKPRTVSVNGVAIPRNAIARETQNHPSAKPIEAWQRAARALAIRELLLQEARRQGLSPQPADLGEGRRETDDEALVRQLVEQAVETPEPDEETCRRYYERNASRFRSPDLYEVAHILIPAGVEAAAQARALLDLLAREPAAFADLAARHSACPSGKVGGALGQIGPGQTVPEFEQALAKLPIASVAPEPVKSRYGLHLVRVDRRIDGRQLPFDLARPLIAAFLGDRVRMVAERQYVSLLAGQAIIEGVTLEAAPTPLVQ